MTKDLRHVKGRASALRKKSLPARAPRGWRAALAAKGPGALAAMRQPTRPPPRRRLNATLLASFGALLLALAGCASAPPQNFGLHAAEIRPLRARGSIVVDMPTAAPPLGGDLLVVREAGDRLTSLAGAQWATSLPLLVQDRTVQTFQNAGLSRALRGPDETADYRLAMMIRRFDIDAPTRTARVEIAAQLVVSGSGRVAAAKIFSASTPVAEIAGAEPPRALDQALGRVLPQIVAWAAANG